MIIGEKNTDLKRLTGRLKLRFLTETGLVSPGPNQNVMYPTSAFFIFCKRIHATSPGLT
jgi:hypothetical protein